MASINYTETFAKIEQFLSDFDQYTPETRENNFRANATGISVGEITSSRVGSQGASISTMDKI